jgi:phosphatidylserine/phosphatidylglycerophosphate/cardiolipin synthase-like enzyme
MESHPVNSKLLSSIHRVAKELPPIALNSLADFLEESAGFYSEELKARILNQLPNLNFRRAVLELLEDWHQASTTLDSQSIALALRSAAYAIASAHSALSAEIVWTGPDVSNIPVRKTEQVLKQLIQEAQRELTIVSFAVYKVPDIAEALIVAMDRGVHLRIIAETPEVGEGKAPFGVVAGLGAEVAQRSEVFIWEKSKRPKGKDGKHGSLHMKCAVADGNDLLISSANLTGYALTLNMEMGLLIHSQSLASCVNNHINQLIHQEVLSLLR